MRIFKNSPIKPLSIQKSMPFLPETTPFKSSYSRRKSTKILCRKTRNHEGVNSSLLNLKTAQNLRAKVPNFYQRENNISSVDLLKASQQLDRNLRERREEDRRKRVSAMILF